MRAYSPNGDPIVGTVEIAEGTATIQERSFRRDPDGTLHYEHDGENDLDQVGSETALENGEELFFDSESFRWRASELVLCDGNFDAALIPTPEPRVEERTYSLALPEGSLRDLSSFSTEEKARLRPIAETLAMLDGNSFFGLTQDANGDDTYYEQYLPESAVLVATTSGSDLASFMRQDDTPRPTWFTDGSEPPFVALDKDGPLKIVLVQNINWDAEEDDETGEAPDLPTEVRAVIAADTPTDEVEDYIIDKLSDKFGFCINAALILDGSTRDLDRLATAYSAPAA